MPAGICPDWNKLRRKRCLNCDKLFRPSRPEHKFDSAECRQAFHHNGGGAYGKLEAQINRLRKEFDLFKERLRADGLPSSVEKGGHGELATVERGGMGERVITRKSPPRSSTFRRDHV